MDEVFIFANPIAGRGRGKRIAERLAQRLRADGWAVRLSHKRPDTFGAADAAGPLRAAVVIGGDGTLRAIADVFLALRGGADVPPLLHVPLGTANLMARHLGYLWTDDVETENAVSAAIRGLRVRHLDSGVANGRLFLLMAGVGFDAHVVHELNRLRTGPIHLLSYILPAALALRDYRFTPLHVIADDRPLWSGEPAVAFVGNVKEYGTGFPVLPYATPDDGLLDACVLPCRSLVDLARLFLHAAAGEHLEQEGAKYARVKTIRIESEPAVPVQVDGDAGGRTPLECSLLPVRLPFIVP